MAAYAEALSALARASRSRATTSAAGSIPATCSPGASVYALAESGWSRIQPEIPAEEHIEFMRRYLLRCIEENPSPGDHLHGGYEAAWELAATLKHWRRASAARIAANVRGVALDLEKIYSRGEPATQNRIQCGVLEHAFEDPALRPHFVNWERDADLRDAYRLAMEWGNAHEAGS